MLLNELHNQKDKILSLGRKYAARRIRVFGSVARGAERADSDIDFLVDFPQGCDLFRQRLPLAEQLQALLGHRVDEVQEHELNPYIREQVLSEVVDL